MRTPFILLCIAPTALLAIDADARGQPGGGKRSYNSYSYDQPRRQRVKAPSNGCWGKRVPTLNVRSEGSSASTVLKQLKNGDSLHVY